MTVNNASQQTATLHQFLDAWKRWDAYGQIATFADDESFRQVTWPTSLNQSARTHAEVVQTLPQLVSVVSDYELNILEVTQDHEAGRAAVYATSKGNTQWGPWGMEYAVFLTFTPAGDKIERLEEMLDSAFAKWFGPYFAQYLKDHAGQ